MNTIAVSIVFAALLGGAVYGDKDAEKIWEHVDKIVGNLMLDLQERGAL